MEPAMQIVFLAACLTICALPLHAQQPLSQAAGNWGGTDKDGFEFIALLTQETGTARLRIWNGLGGIVEGDDPQFDNADMVLSAYTIDNGQRLAVVETVDGTTLQVITEFADEAYEGQVVVDIQFLDNQFTVIGYHLHDVANEGNVAFDCDVDLWNGTTTVNGRTTELPARDFESLNASVWTYDTPRDKGICPGLD
jgi:hypothetical protein